MGAWTPTTTQLNWSEKFFPAQKCSCFATNGHRLIKLQKNMDFKFRSSFSSVYFALAPPLQAVYKSPRPCSTPPSPSPPSLLSFCPFQQNSHIIFAFAVLRFVPLWLTSSQANVQYLFSREYKMPNDSDVIRYDNIKNTNRPFGEAFREWGRDGKSFVLANGDINIDTETACNRTT